MWPVGGADTAVTDKKSEQNTSATHVNARFSPYNASMERSNTDSLPHKFLEAVYVFVFACLLPVIAGPRRFSKSVLCISSKFRTTELVVWAAFKRNTKHEKRKST